MRMNNILITGGTGFLGRKLIERIYSKCDKITVLARNEGKLITLQQQYPDIDIICGDVANRCIADKACEGQDILYHFAAFKHVGIAEDQPLQCTESNVRGTINLIESFEGHEFIFTSTDKAAKMQGVYGASKYICERLLNEASDTYWKTHYTIVRYGNVIGSTGSVIPKWIESAKFQRDITVTDPDATRFFFTVDEALDLIDEARKECKTGEVYYKEMKSCTIDTLLQAIIEKYGSFGAIGYIGLQPGENKHELLYDNYSSEQAEKISVEDLIKLI